MVIIITVETTLVILLPQLTRLYLTKYTLTCHLTCSFFIYKMKEWAKRSLVHFQLMTLAPQLNPILKVEDTGR